MLHLGVPEAWKHARDVLFGCCATVGAIWLKWDFNTNLGTGGWAPSLPGR